ncbi:hypothetical protein QJV03_10210 [Listeria swaminathanii]|uniref:Uncharacterized protein n=1 Tax=Listeria swaminathanii TaxID=2713501 RepID=A0ABU2IFF2_9LIST|nr:hypothetical protein [Listeria swaminathanii]MDT0017554.1 hypothetical protein [Listeria swaminathanii]MDT0022643.1 hypothetical protein [Listeria swaminathanii]MDT0033607.1 hypothetical protein [Listeria swaminathanii]MDT0052441.1 hypothetical protein [Listeria swaminathanii]MDT0055206.1 hypothetical protein [Listeria swaminathanii]
MKTNVKTTEADWRTDEEKNNVFFSKFIIIGRLFQYKWENRARKSTKRNYSRAGLCWTGVFICGRE